MRKSKILAKLQQGAFPHICLLGYYLPFFVRYAAHFDFDGIWLDLEHQTISEREVQSLLSMCHYNDVDSMVRPATREAGVLNRYLEDGATGFMFPMVDTTQMAKQLVQAVKYPPLGDRGFGGAGLDADYILDAFKPGSTYIQDANRETFICVQIETPEAVMNAEEISAVSGIDMLFIGPADLGLRLSNDMTMEKAVDRVSKAAQKHQKAWGIYVDSEADIVHYRQLGAQILPFGHEYELLGVLEAASQALQKV